MDRSCDNFEFLLFEDVCITVDVECTVPKLKMVINLSSVGKNLTPLKLNIIFT